MGCLEFALPGDNMKLVSDLFGYFNIDKKKTSFMHMLITKVQCKLIGLSHYNV